MIAMASSSSSSGPLVLMTVACRLDGASPSNENGNPNPNPNPNPIWSRIALSKPSWVVRTESNVWKDVRKRPQPPCVVCKGSGRVDCHHCQGKGRTNCVNATMLPKGEWPKWCTTCGGSGLGYCNRCLGTGEYRDVMGFRFMKVNTNSTQSQESTQ